MATYFFLVFSSRKKKGFFSTPAFPGGFVTLLYLHEAAPPGTQVLSSRCWAQAVAPGAAPAGICTRGDAVPAGNTSTKGSSRQSSCPGEVKLLHWQRWDSKFKWFFSRLGQKTEMFPFRAVDLSKRKHLTGFFQWFIILETASEEEIKMLWVSWINK